MAQMNRPTLKHPAWWLLAMPMAAPVLLILAALGTMLFYSFTRFDVLSAPTFIGLENYMHLLTDPLYWSAVGNTLLYLLLGGGIAVAVGWLCGSGAARLSRPLRLVLVVLFGVGTLLSLCQQSWLVYIFSGDAYGLLNSLLLQFSGQMADSSVVSGLITQPILWSHQYPVAIRLLQLVLIGVGPAFFIFYVGGRTGRRRTAWHTAVAALPMWLVLYWGVTLSVTGTPTLHNKGLWLPEYLNDCLHVRFDIGYSGTILMSFLLLLAALVGAAQVIVWLCTRRRRPTPLVLRPGVLGWSGGAVGLLGGVLVMAVLLLLVNGAIKSTEEWFRFPPSLLVERPTLENFLSTDNACYRGFLHLLPVYWLVSVVYYCTVILPPAFFFAFSDSRPRRILLTIWLGVVALAPLTYFSFLWWSIGVVDALVPILRLCCHFSPLYPACMLLTVLLLRRAAAGCQRPAELFRSGRRMLGAIAGVMGCCALFPLSLLFSLNGSALLYRNEYHFPLQQLSALSGTIHMGKGFAWTVILIFAGLVLCLFALAGLTISAVLAAKNRRVDEE